MVNHFWELLKCFELVVISKNCWHVGRTDLWLKETRSIACSCIGYQRKAPCRWLEGRRHGRVHSASSILLPTVKGGRENPVIHRHQFLWLFLPTFDFVRPCPPGVQLRFHRFSLTRLDASCLAPPVFYLWRENTHEIPSIGVGSHLPSMQHLAQLVVYSLAARSL